VTAWEGVPSLGGTRGGVGGVGPGLGPEAAVDVEASLAMGNTIWVWAHH
jgi:hypothetical protein